jgi:hypothetical protein
MAVGVAALLAARTPLHHFVRSVLTEREVNDAMIFAARPWWCFRCCPIRRSDPMAPQSAVDLDRRHSGDGHQRRGICSRSAARRAVWTPLAGFASGFISSAATIGAMGRAVSEESGCVSAAVAGAALSTVATVIQMCLVLAATSPVTLRALSAPLICAGIAAAAYGAGFTVRALRERDAARPQPGPAFSLPVALEFALTLSADAHRLDRAAGMVRRDRASSSGRRRPASSTRIPRHRDCFAGGIRKDDRRRRRISYSSPRSLPIRSAR